MSEIEIKLLAALREGCVPHAKRWSGDTHDDLGGSIDQDATDALMLVAAAAIDRLTAERDAAVAERDAVRNAVGNEAVERFIEKHGKPVPLVVALKDLLSAAIRARRCLAWACDQRPEFNAEYEALDTAIDAARLESE